LDAQASGEQVVFFAYSWHAPAPSHLPLVPQLGAPLSLQVLRGSAFPAATIVHLPTEPVSAQLRQAPVQPLSQQTPSTHWPDLHSAPAPQGWPFSFSPQVPFRQPVPPLQSLSTLHDPVHAACWQRNGAQSCKPGARQVPRPSQVVAVLSRVPEQLAALHWVPVA
jgi:hypothetical protein